MQARPNGLATLLLAAGALAAMGGGGLACAVTLLLLWLVLHRGGAAEGGGGAGASPGRGRAGAGGIPDAIFSEAGCSDASSGARAGTQLARFRKLPDGTLHYFLPSSPMGWQCETYFVGVNVQLSC